MEQDPQFLDDLRQFVGATITGVEMTVNEPIETIRAFFNVRTPDGNETTMSGPMLREVTDSGIAAFDLQEEYDQDELRGLIEGAVADPDNGLDDDDRKSLREELAELPNYY